MGEAKFFYCLIKPQCSLQYSQCPQYFSQYSRGIFIGHVTAHSGQYAQYWQGSAASRTRPANFASYSESANFAASSATALTSSAGVAVTVPSPITTATIRHE